MRVKAKVRMTIFGAAGRVASLHLKLPPTLKHKALSPWPIGLQNHWLMAQVAHRDQNERQIALDVQKTNVDVCMGFITCRQCFKASDIGRVLICIQIILVSFRIC